MLEQLIINHGISMDKQSGLTCRTLSEFGSSGLHHPAEAVRKVAERILVLIYKVNPRLVRKQLPPDDDITRRNLLYRQLFQEFDKIDLKRKVELLEKNKLLQKCSVASSSPESVGKQNDNKQVKENDCNQIDKGSETNNKYNGHSEEIGVFKLRSQNLGINHVQNIGVQNGQLLVKLKKTEESNNSLQDETSVAGSSSNSQEEVEDK